MSTRNTTIRISDDEKELLDQAAKAEFGTDEVPYGATVERLAEKTIEGAN
jgi:hypothetical protein